jgi:hypothetical protein
MILRRVTLSGNHDSVFGLSVSHSVECTRNSDCLRRQIVRKIAGKMVLRKDTCCGIFCSKGAPARNKIRGTRFQTEDPERNKVPQNTILKEKRIYKKCVDNDFPKNTSKIP